MSSDLCIHAEVPEACPSCATSPIAVKAGQNGHESHAHPRARENPSTYVSSEGTEQEQEQEQQRRPLFRSASAIAEQSREDDERWPVPGLFGPGLTLFFAAAKIGKTRTLMDIGWNVASGNPALGSLLTHQGDVLMVLSETPDDDLKGMWSENWPDMAPPSNLSVASQEDWYAFVDRCRSRRDVQGNPGNVRLGHMLNEWLEQAEKPGLVVIDNLTNCVLNHQQADRYKRPQTLDYEAQSNIRRWSRENDVPVILLHHTNQTKMEKGDDWTFRSAGTGGINSVPDHLMWLDQDEGGLTLRAKGRRFRQSEYRLVWRGSNIFMFDPVPVSRRLGSRMHLLAEAFARTKSPGMGTPAELAALTGESPATTRTYLLRLVEQGVLTREERGIYKIVMKGESE